MKREHRITCGSNREFNAFYTSNLKFIHVIGMWLKVRPENNFVGMHITVDDDPEKETKVTPIEEQSLEILLQDIAGKPRMKEEGYPDSLVVVIAWKGTKMCLEIDLVVNAAILYGNCPLFDQKELHKFMVPPGAALRGERRDEWYATFRPSLLKRDWMGYPEWHAIKFS